MPENAGVANFRVFFDELATVVFQAPLGTPRFSFFLQILQFTDTRSALSQSQKARRIKGTVIRSCKATRRARSGARRMTVHSYLRRAFNKKVRRE